MTTFEEEIRSQPAVLAGRASAGAVMAARVAASWRDASYAVVGARGSSDNAAKFFQYLAGREVGLVVALATPSLYVEPSPLSLRDAAVLAISQSGRSPGIAEVLTHARSQGRPTAALTNDLASPLARGADLVMDMAAGPERAVASSKTFAATWHALAQLVAALSPRGLDGLEEVSAVASRLVPWALGSDLPLDLLDATRGITVVGRGVGAAVADEIALKVREVSGIRAEGYAASDFAHGPVGADGDGSTLLFVVTEETPEELVDLTLAGARRSGMASVVVRPRSRRAVACDSEIVIPEELPNWLSALAGVWVGQAIALRLGERRGRDVDHSPGLAKVTLGV